MYDLLIFLAVFIGIGIAGYFLIALFWVIGLFLVVRSSGLVAQDEAQPE